MIVADHPGYFPTAVNILPDIVNSGISDSLILTGSLTRYHTLWNMSQPANRNHFFVLHSNEDAIYCKDTFLKVVAHQSPNVVRSCLV